VKVNLYKGCFSLIKKSGVGQSIIHQKEMLESMGVGIAERWSEPSDVVHFNAIFPDSFIASLVARLQKKKIVYYGHSTMEDFRNSFRFSNFFAPLFKRWITLCYRQGDVIITPTEYSKKILRGYGISRPIYSLSNGVNTDVFAPGPEHGAAFRKKYGLGPEDKAVISVGLYIERKGILDFIRLAREMPEVHFFWFGYTNLNLVPEKIRSAVEKAPENLCFPGYVEREELRDAYCGCNLFAFMSTEETEGIVVLEALACGTPTILRDIPVYDGWLEDGVNVYKAEDISMFTRKIRSMLNGRMTDLTGAGIRTARGRSILEIGRKLMAIYEHEHIGSAPVFIQRRTGCVLSDTERKGHPLSGDVLR